MCIRTNLCVLKIRSETYYLGNMQTTLLDYIPISSFKRLKARLRVLVKERCGKKLIIESITICRGCGEYGVVRGYILSSYGGKMARREFGFKITLNKITLLDKPPKFVDGLCDFCLKKKAKRSNQ